MDFRIYNRVFDGSDVMAHHTISEPDYGTGHKKLSIYLIGMVICVILTLLAFWVVTTPLLSRAHVFLTIYAAASIQFLVQVICFLRLNTKTEQGLFNVMAFIYTGLILVCIIAGSLWIMYNLDYYMMN